MSFVSILATQRFITVVSDGRVINIAQNKPIREDYQKFQALTNNSFICFAGDLEPCERFVRQLKDENQRLDDFQQLGKYTTSKLACYKDTGTRILIAVGGKNPQGEIEFFKFSTLDPCLKYFRPKAKDIAYAFLHNSSGQAESLDLDELLITYLKEYGVDTHEKVTLAQKALTRDVASRDVSVNTNCFSHYINK